MGTDGDDVLERHLEIRLVSLYGLFLKALVQSLKVFNQENGVINFYGIR